MPVTREVMERIRDDALARANKVRLNRAALKRDIGAGRRSIAEVINTVPWEAASMTLSELLCAQRRWGMARARKLLFTCHLAEDKTLETLTTRQRRVLTKALKDKAAGKKPVFDDLAR